MSAGGGELVFLGTFDNSVGTGVLNSNSTVIRLSGGGTNDGSFNIATLINVDGGT